MLQMAFFPWFAAFPPVEEHSNRDGIERTSQVSQNQVNYWAVKVEIPTYKLRDTKMQFHNAAIWIDHETAHITRFNREEEDFHVIHATHSKEQLHHKSGSIGAGNVPPHRDYFRHIISTVGDIPEVLIVGPADAKNELMKYAEQHSKDFVSHVVKVETLDRVTQGELIAYARRFFHEKKPRINTGH